MLIDQLSDVAGTTKVDAGRFLDALQQIITGAMARGEKVTWTGFGTFEVRPRKERMGRDPQKGTPLLIPATRTPAFKAGKSLKDAVK